MNNFVSSKLFSLSIIITILLIFFLRFYSMGGLHNTEFNYAQLHQLYLNSQYNNGFLIMEDSQLYTYAGFTYLIQGKFDEINIEHPPLGKYLIGLSVLFSKSTIFYQLSFAFTLLTIVFLISLKYLNNIYLAIIPTLMFMVDKLFLSRSFMPELDIPVTVFILFYIFIMSLGRLTVRKTVLLGIILGLSSGIKYPTAAFILYLATLIYFILIKEKKIFQKMFTLGLIAIFIFVLQYTPLILNRGFGAFIDVQIRAVKIHLSHVPEYPPLAASKVMLLNRWPSWWNNAKPVNKVAEWSILWPLLWFTIFGLPLFLYLTKKKAKNLYFGIIFLGLYFLFINSRLFFPHYLMPVLAIGYPLLFWELKQLSEYLLSIRSKRSSVAN